MPRRPGRPHVAVLCALTWLACLNVSTRAHAQSQRAADTRYQDAHVDRVIMSSTAETHPEGTAFGSLYVVLPQVGYALTQRLQLSLTGFSDLGSRGNFVFDLTAKANLLRTRTLRVAALTSIALLHADRLSLAFGRIGAAAQWCFAATCESSINASGMVVLHDKGDLLIPYGGALGFVGHLSGVAKLLLEYGTLSSLADSFVSDQINIWYVGYGLRFSRPSWGFDVVFLRHMALKVPENRPSGPNIIDVLGLPLLIFTYRVGHD